MLRRCKIHYRSIHGNDCKICKVCQRICNIGGNGSLSWHLKQAHGIDVKSYFDIYFKDNEDGICLNCGKQTPFQKKFWSYSKYCNHACNLSKQMRERWRSDPDPGKKGFSS